MARDDSSSIDGICFTDVSCVQEASGNSEARIMFPVSERVRNQQRFSISLVILEQQLAVICRL